MKFENFFKDMFDSLPDYRKIEFLIISFKDDKDLLKECGFLKSDFDRSYKKYKTILIEQNEENLGHIKNQEEAVIEQFLDK